MQNVYLFIVYITDTYSADLKDQEPLVADIVVTRLWTNFEEEKNRTVGKNITYQNFNNTVFTQKPH